MPGLVLYLYMGAVRLPPGQVLLIGLKADFRDAAKVDRAQRCDVCNREALASDEGTVGQHPVEPRETALGVLALDLCILGHLGNAAFEELMPVPKRICD